MTLYNGTNQIILHSTQYNGLKYANTNPAGKALWRIIDCHDVGREAPVGPLYASKAELLADLTRYATTWGY